MSFPACPCCGQPWYATERRTLIGPVFVTPHGWARLSRYELAAVSFLLDGEPVDRATLARHIDPDKPPTDKRAKATAESIKASTWGLSPTSQATKSASPPPAWMASATSSPLAASTSLKTILAPSEAKRSAQARPMPMAAPVTIATLSLRRMFGSSACDSDFQASCHALPLAASGPSGV